MLTNSRRSIMAAARPQPSEADWIEAMAFVTETYVNDPTVSRSWLADRLETLTRYAADAAMQKRQEREFRAAVRKLGASLARSRKWIAERELVSAQQEGK